MNVRTVNSSTWIDYCIYVTCKVQIETIHGFSCANLGSELCATILGLHSTKCVKNGWMPNPWIVRVAQSLDCTQKCSKCEWSGICRMESSRLKIMLYSQPWLTIVHLCTCIGLCSRIENSWLWFKYVHLCMYFVADLLCRCEVFCQLLESLVMCHRSISIHVHTGSNAWKRK